MNKATTFFIKLNAFLVAQRILALDEAIELSEPFLTLAWEVLYDLSGYARPVEGWAK